MSRLKREEWQTHPTYTDYEVSDWGRVRRRTPYKSTWMGRILKVTHSRGYPYVPLLKDGKEKRKSVHRLVLETFVGPRPEGA